MSTTTAPECGTYSGLQRHNRLGQEPCQPCRDAGAERMRDYRKRPGHQAKDRWWGRTRQAALEALAREYPERFAALLAAERAAGQSPYADTPGGSR